MCAFRCGTQGHVGCQLSLGFLFWEDKVQRDWLDRPDILPLRQAGTMIIHYATAAIHYLLLLLQPFLSLPEAALADWRVGVSFCSLLSSLHVVPMCTAAVGATDSDSSALNLSQSLDSFQVGRSPSIFFGSHVVPLHFHCIAFTVFCRCLCVYLWACTRREREREMGELLFPSLSTLRSATVL